MPTLRHPDLGAAGDDAHVGVRRDAYTAAHDDAVHLIAA